MVDAILAGARPGAGLPDFWGIRCELTGTIEIVASRFVSSAGGNFINPYALHERQYLVHQMPVPEWKVY
jgi:hypothetical protein